MPNPSDLAVCPCKATSQDRRSSPAEGRNNIPLNPHLHNPELLGEEFYWSGGPVGILLCHGFTATTAEVRPLARCLHAAGYTVAGPLLPGHNTTPEDLNRVRWQDWVETFDAMLERLYARCEAVVVGGESTGGLLSLYHAIHDPRPAAILAYAPALRLTLKPVVQILLRLMAPFKTSWAKRNMRSGTPWQGYRVNPLKGTLQLIQLQKQVDPFLSQIYQPLLIIQGRQDITVHPGVPERIASRVASPIKEIHWMENSPHTVIVDQELDQVARITLQFLKDAGLPPPEDIKNVN